MKKLLAVLFLAFSLSSCYEDIKKSVESSSKETTAYLQNLPKDTSVTVAYDNHTVYVFDKQSDLLIYKADSVNGDAFPIHFFVFIVLLCLAFLCGASVSSW